MGAARGVRVREQLERAAARLAGAGVEPARVDAEWLLAGLLGVGRAELALALDQELPPALARRYEAVTSRRAGREPLQQILGWEAFRDLRLGVTPAVLIPRPETELLVEWALELLPRPTVGRSPRVVDVGTGSGCVACAIAQERADAVVVATDRSLAALEVARANVQALGLAGRVRLLAADLVAALGPERADLVVANLPYLPTGLVAELGPEVREHEPRVALDGGADGLAVLRPLVGEAGRTLRPSGALVLETAGDSQAPVVADLLRAGGFQAIAVRRDLTGVERFVAGRRAGGV